MAPMITDSYLSYNDTEFGNSNQTSKYYNPNTSTTNTNTSNKPPLPNLNYPIMSDQQQNNNFNFGIRRAYSEETIIEILKGNIFKQQYDLFEELILQAQGNSTDSYLLNIKNLDEFYASVGYLLLNTISNEVQRSCLKFLQLYFKLIDKIKQRRKTDLKLKEKFKSIDNKLSKTFLEYLILASVSSKLQLKQISIDLIYSYMKLTDDLIENCFNEFIKIGIENSDLNISKQFMDPTLCILITEEFHDTDFSQLIKSLIKQSSNLKCESSALKCLNKIESITDKDKFNSFINKLPANLKNSFINLKNNNSNTNQFKFQQQQLQQSLNDSVSESDSELKFNLIPSRILNKLSGEDEIQRLQAINQLESTIKNLRDIKAVYPYYQDFIVYMTKFVDDPNYEIRLGSIKILSLFIEKLGLLINQCYKAICQCARNAMTQTHQSKTMKQALTSMILLTIDYMSAPILILEALLEKIKDRNAKAREEILNLIIACVLKFPNDKYESLKKIFNQIVVLLFDIKRNVRHAALELIAVLVYKMKQLDRNSVDILLDQLDQLNEFQNYEALSLIKDVILYRLNRNKIAVLNSDMTLEYGVKIPTNGGFYTNGFDLDIEWIVSASSSGSASNISSARSQKLTDSSQNIPMINSNQNGNHRVMNISNSNMPISTGSFRRPSGTKRFTWEESNDLNNNQIPKVVRSREVAPLKAFPLNDESDFNNLQPNNLLSNNNNNSKINGYPSTSSYQEKYLKKLQSDQMTTNNNTNTFHHSKTDSQLDLSDISSTAIKLQNEKAYSLENLYNYDENINSENNVQKRKYANLNLKNGIIPSKPIIPRRNSANRYNSNTSEIEDLNNNSILNTSNRTNFDFELETNSQYSLIDDLNNSSRSINNNNNKFDTVPSIRNSAKNRKKLDKIFSIGPNSTAINVPNHNTNIKTKNLSNEENNLYLSKLKADKLQHDMNTSRYSPSNPESGIFSLSDYEHTENKFIKLQQEANKQKNSKIQQSNNVEYSPLAGVSFKQTHGSDVEIVGVKLGNNNNQSTNNDSNNSTQSQSSNNNNNANLALKKKNSLKNLNESNLINIDNDTSNNDILDVVGKGYYSNENDQNEYGSNNTEQDFPLSLSFRSRLRQKTQEKIEEKHKKRVEKLKANQKKELENLNSSINYISINNNQSPVPNDDGYNNKTDQNFGLSISSYQNQPIVYTKPPIYQSQNSEEQQIYTLEDFDNNIKKLNKSNSNSGYDFTSEYPEEFESPSTTLPSLEKPKFQPTKATQARKARAAAAQAQPQTKVNPELQRTNSNNQSNVQKRPETPKDFETENLSRIVKEDYVKQPFKNPENAFKEAMNHLSQENWENKCHAMNMIRRLSVYHEDLAVNNIHAIVLALVQEVKNLRSQVSRFALMTFGDLFVNLKKYMDVDLDIAVKTILQKNSETNEFIRVDIEKCLEKMINNVTTTKAIVALINGGASHRNPLIRRTTAQYVYKCCELMGPGKILSGIKDITERILITASQFVVDGPVDIRWYGRKIFNMLMAHDDFDRLLVKYLNEKTRKNIKEILDTIRAKGPGEVPTESARNARKGIRNGNDLISRSAGSNSNGGSRPDIFNGISESNSNTSTTRPHNHPPLPPPTSIRLDPQSQEYIKTLCTQLRNPDFKERIDAIEKFQVLCETETNIAVANLVQIFDKFNPCLTDSNSKVNYKALNTMYQITPLLLDDLNPVLVNVIPLIAQNLASKNSEIQDMASNILDVFVEYLDGGSLIQPFTNIAQHGNARIKPQIIFKLADLISHVYSRKQKQVEMHVLQVLWNLLNSMKGNTTSSGANSLNSAIAKLVQNLYEQMGDLLIDRASNNSAVSARNLELLKEMISL